VKDHLSNFREQNQGVQTDPMTSKFVRNLLALAFAVTGIAVAQTGAAAASPSAALPTAPSSANTTTITGGTGTKVGTINMTQAILASNEGRRDFEALSKKLEPRETELKGKNDEIEALKKQLNTQGDKLNEEARANLVKQIDTKQKALDRNMQDAREEFNNQQNELAQKILQKMGPIVIKYAADNGFGMLIDTSQQWPQGPVLWNNDAVDVTKAVVDTYNLQSGVAAPAGGGAKPATTPKPAGSTTKPATPPATKPQ
jgi:outer membrane protein